MGKKFKDLKKHQVPLTPEERALVRERKATWSGGDSAVWKSVDPKTGEVTYVTHTHRAFNTAPTLKGAIGRFHNFIKSTASEDSDDGMDKVAEYKESMYQNAIENKKDYSSILKAIGTGAVIGGGLGVASVGAKSIAKKLRLNKIPYEDLVKKYQGARTDLAMDIKYGELSKKHLSKLVDDSRIAKDYIGKTYNQKLPKKLWNKSSLDSASYSAVSEAYNKDYLTYLDDMARHVNGKKTLSKGLATGAATAGAGALTGLAAKAVHDKKRDIQKKAQDDNNARGEGMDKEAASFDARRKKQYWQLLKRLYGGAEDAIKSVKSTGDAGIYHGTPALKKVLETGLQRPKNFAHNNLGRGIYMGSAGKAKNYGEMLRLKKPSEFASSDKTLYPSIARASKGNYKLNPKKADPVSVGLKTYGPKSLKERAGNEVFKTRDKEMLTPKQMNDDTLYDMAAKKNYQNDNLVTKNMNKSIYGELKSEGSGKGPKRLRQTAIRIADRNPIAPAVGNELVWDVPKVSPSLLKQAQDDSDFDSNGKIPALEKAFADPIAKKVAYMIATSHEYKKPNVAGALQLVKNYKWEESTAPINSLQGINKPINEEKVTNMATSMKGKKMKPLMVVNQFDAIRPQTPGKKILLDGHHRWEAAKLNGETEVPIYKGTYTGDAHKSLDELKEKTASQYLDELYKIAEMDNEEKAIAGAGAVGAGGLLTKKIYDKGHLTGRETLWHNTDKKNVASIKDQGIKSSFSTDPNNWTNTMLKDIPMDQKAGKVYLARKKGVADSVGAAASRKSDFDTPIELLRRNRQNRSTLKAKVPTWMMKEVDNPELYGAKNIKEYRKIIDSKEGPANEVVSRLRARFQDGIYGRKGTATIEGDIAPKYIKGSKHYQKAGLGEIKNFIKANPKRFAKGALGAAGGLALAGLGTKMLVDAAKGKEKTASQYLDELVKTASPKKDDPFRTTKTVAKLNTIDIGAGALQDSVATALAIAASNALYQGRGKLKSAVKGGLPVAKQVFTSPDAKRTLKDFARQQAFNIPISAALAGIYTGLAYKGDIKQLRSKLNDQGQITKTALEKKDIPGTSAWIREQLKKRREG